MSQYNVEKGSHQSDRDICYHNDYSPRYEKPCNIYKKARLHMKKIKTEHNKKEADA
ncbi:MAG: hypothetical protein MRZ41_10975 [Eubacterium sp.]|nr:hypothetical protein [Eubacterium sp.]